MAACPATQKPVTQKNDVAARFTMHLAVADGSRCVAAADEIKFDAHVVADGDQFVAVIDGIAVTDADGNLFTATVSELAAEGSGKTPATAENALIRALRGWLERQDTAGKLADTLGVAHLDEETEITLQFIDPVEAERRRSDWVTARPPSDEVL